MHEASKHGRFPPEDAEYPLNVDLKTDYPLTESIGQSWRNNKRLSSLFPPVCYFSPFRERSIPSVSRDDVEQNLRKWTIFVFGYITPPPPPLFGKYIRSINHSASEFASRNDHSNALEEYSFTCVLSLLGFTLFSLVSSFSFIRSIRFESVLSSSRRRISGSTRYLNVRS